MIEQFGQKTFISSAKHGPLNHSKSHDYRLYPLTQDGYVHLRHGHSVRSEFGWAGTPGPVNCDFAYVFYNHFEQQGLPMEVNEACMFEERRIVSQLFKHLKQSLGALGQVPAGVVGNRTDRIVTIGQQGYTQGRGIHPSLDMYSNDRAVNHTGVNMGLISSLYGPMVRERYAQMQGKRFFVSMTAKTTYYDENAQTLKVLLNIPPHIMATQRTDPNQQNLVYVTGPDFVQDPKAYDRDLNSNLNNKIVLHVPMTTAEYRAINGLKAYYAPRFEVFFSVINAQRMNIPYVRAPKNILNIDVDKVVMHRVLSAPIDKARSPYEARTIML